jgi:predicted nucleic acid-binding protein
VTTRRQPLVLYWDASAVLSALVQDTHSKAAVRWSGRDGLHLVSTLGWAETTAVLYRLAAEGHFTKVLLHSALESLTAGPWRLIHRGPDRDQIDSLAAKYALRGADLWHLAQVRSLLGELPAMKLLTFDRRLREAAEAEGMLPGE